MKKRVLVLGSGGFAGAYSAGFMAELCRNLGPNYFDEIYAYSVGAYIGTFYIANQPNTIENTWKNNVGGRKFASFLHIFSGRKIEDLDYLDKLFKNNISLLNVYNVKKSKVKIYYPITNYYSGKLVFADKEYGNIFDLMKATASLPIVYGKVKVGSKYFLDGSFVYGGLPGIKNIVRKNKDILIIMNFPSGYKKPLFWRFMTKFVLPILTIFYPKRLQMPFKNKFKREKETSQFLETYKKIKVIRPSKEFILKSANDTKSERIAHLIDQGKKDAREYVKNIKR